MIPQRPLGKTEIVTRLGYTQIELAEKTGIILRSIQRIEKGEVQPGSFTIKALIEVLKFSNQELITLQTDQALLKLRKG